VTSGESFSPQPAGLKLGPNPHPKRRWPWGTWEADSPLYQANVSESRSDRTMAVGSFPAGASPYGCLDLAGNVWEWTLSLYRPYPYQPDDRNDPEAAGNRTLRGGAWFDVPRRARVSARSRRQPGDFYYGIGVRLVVAPV
jgi:formylglycine-generating enzyme required for sulfatase activity